jgi:hypothetical protein
MKHREELALVFRPILIWTAAIVLGIMLFGTVDSLLEPECAPSNCNGAACWDLRSMWY